MFPSLVPSASVQYISRAKIEFWDVYRSSLLSRQIKCTRAKTFLFEEVDFVRHIVKPYVYLNLCAQEPYQNLTVADNYKPEHTHVAKGTHIDWINTQWKHVVL